MNNFYRLFFKFLAYNSVIFLNNKKFVIRKERVRVCMIIFIVWLRV